eukprot:sb/3464397/
MQFNSLSFVSAPVQHSAVTNNRVVSDEPVLFTNQLINTKFFERSKPDLNNFKHLNLEKEPTESFTSSSKQHKTLLYGSESSGATTTDSEMFSIFVNKSEREMTFSYTPEVPSQEWVRKNVDKVLGFLGLSSPPFTDWYNVNYLTQIKTYFSHRADIIYTGIPKSGCTNWKFTILRLEKMFWEDTPTPKVHYIINSISISNILRRYPYMDLNDKYTFTVIRNPWTRIVSGYNDKFAPERFQKWQGGRVSLDILQRYRDPSITLRELFKRGLRPTFLEFLRYLAEDPIEAINVHFQPQYNMLSLSEVNYNFIGALEHAQVQSQEILKHFAMQRDADVSVPGPYDSSSDPRVERSTILARRWFPKVPKYLLDKLYEKFKPDFMLFNYTNYTDPLFPFPYVFREKLMLTSPSICLSLKLPSQTSLSFSSFVIIQLLSASFSPLHLLIVESISRSYPLNCSSFCHICLEPRHDL